MPNIIKIYIETIDKKQQYKELQSSNTCDPFSVENNGEILFVVGCKCPNK